MKKIIFLLCLLVLSVIVLVIAYRNAEMVSFNYAFGEIQLPLAWLFFGAFLSGFLLAFLWFASIGLGWKFKAKSLQKQLDSNIRQEQRQKIAEQFAAQKNA